MGPPSAFPAALPHWLRRWRLTPDGPPISTASSLLLPVIADGKPAMLKISRIEEEQRGSRLLALWNGKGAAVVYAIADDATLMERGGGRSVRQLVEEGRDEEAVSIICRVAAGLHSSFTEPPEFLVPLRTWFRPLLEAGGRSVALRQAADAAASLLATSGEAVALHGDLHHDNVLEFGDRDWRAIDPKGLVGDRGFDFIHLLRNPDIDAAPGLLERRSAQVAREAGLETRRLLSWLVAFSGLSAVWLEADGDDAEPDLALMRQAQALLQKAPS